MKKIFLLLLIFISIKVFGQFTQPQNFGSKTTLVQNKGGFVSDSALILPHFTDTTRANLGPAPDFYAGNIIRTVDTPWMRSDDATRWISLFPKNTTITADNGLTMSTATNVQLGSSSGPGSPLLHDTYINGTANYTFTYNSQKTGNSTGFVVGNSSSGIGAYIYSGSGYGFQAESFTGTAAVFTVSPSASAVKKAIEIQAISGASSAGFGSSIDYFNWKSDGNSSVANQLISKWTTATAGSQTSQFIITGVESATTQNVLVINGDGSIQFPQYVGGQFTGTPLYGLAVDASGNVILDSVSSGGGGISGITADNGLTANTSTNVQLGGPVGSPSVFLNDRYIDATANYTLFITGQNPGYNSKVVDISNTVAGADAVHFSAVDGNAAVGTSTDASGFYGVSQNSSGLSGVSTSLYGLYASSVSNSAALLYVNPTSTDVVANVLQLDRESSNTPADGMGSSIKFRLETTTQTQLSNEIISKWTTAANATRTSEFSITGVDNATTQDLLTLAGSGAAKLNQYGAGTFSGTAAFTLAVDASGNVIEVTGGGGGISSLTSVGGGLDIQSGGAGNINTLNASDFNLASNLISIDYTNGQAASGSNKGFLTSADWTTFNNKANAALDNLASVAINTSLLPATDDAIDLGSATKQWRDLYMTGASIYMSGVKTLSAAGLDLPTGGGIRTRTSAGNTVLFQAYDVDGTAYVTFGTLTANNTPTFNLSTAVTVGGDPILTTVAAAAAYQPLDADLTTIAGLTATTDNFIVSVSSAWASRTPAQVRTTLGLVIGTDVQAWDADLDTWAGITPASGVGTYLATPNSANLRSMITDENGTGALLFNAATTPSFTTGIQIGGAAASRKILVGDGTNFVPSTETWATPGTSGDVLTSDGTNWVSSSTVKYAAASAGTTTSNSLVDLTGMSIALTAGTWVFDIWIFGQAGTGTAGAQFGVNYSGTTTSIEANCSGQLSGTTLAATTRITAVNTASVIVMTTSAAEEWVHISGKIVVSNSGNLTAKGLKVTSQTLTWRASSWMKAFKVA